MPENQRNSTLKDLHVSQEKKPQICSKLFLRYTVKRKYFFRKFEYIIVS